MRDLIAQYGVLGAGRRATAARPQAGAQLADRLGAVLVGYRRAGQRPAGGGRDEIDVVFAVEHARFILEPKWLKAPVSAEPVANLADRIRSRVARTRGVLLSMSGYTKPVPEAAEHNKWPDDSAAGPGSFRGDAVRSDRPR